MMRLLAAVAVVGLGCCAAVRAREEPLDYDQREAPSYTLPSTGASVYHAPPSGGIVRVLDEDPRSSSAPPRRRLPSDGDADWNLDDPDARAADEVFRVDLTGLDDLGRDRLTVDLGGGRVVEFHRDLEYDALHPSAGPGELRPTPRRRLRRRRHRRIADLASTASVPPEDCHVVDNPGYCRGASGSPAVDYLPPNGYVDPLDPCMRFEYFEGSGTLVVEGAPTRAGIYLKRLTFCPSPLADLPGNERRRLIEGREYLSGTISTEAFEYKFRGDAETGDTLVVKQDPATFPGMPDPIYEEPDEAGGWDGGEGGGEDGDPGTSAGWGSAPAIVDRRLRGSVRGGGGDDDDLDAAEFRELLSAVMRGDVPSPRAGDSETRRRARGARSASRREEDAEDVVAERFDGYTREQRYDYARGLMHRHVRKHAEKEKRRREVERNLEPNYVDGSIIDIQIPFTTTAMCEHESISWSACTAEWQADPTNRIGIINLAEEAVAWTNQAYINSGIQTQLRLVLVHETTPGFDDNPYSCVDLLYMLRNVDGQLDDVHPLRNEWGADMVALLTSRGVSGCGGIAFVGHMHNHNYQSIMFSLTLRPYATTVVAHELGHNFGCEHDRLNSSRNWRPYQFGWHDPQKRFRSIMAYRCPNARWGQCPRVQIFSNSEGYLYNGMVAGDASNDCARMHNEVRQKIANYRSVRVTSAPTGTATDSPSASAQPTAKHSTGPSLEPSVSLAPSQSPSVSAVPTGLPSEWPTFSDALLGNYLRLQSPGSVTFHVANGIMFDVTAKDYDITIHQFALPFLNGGDMVLHMYVLETGSFWYEKNNKDAWTQKDQENSLEVHSPGITLQDPKPISNRGGADNYGFEPISIPAGATVGIYIFIDEAASPDTNYIAMDREAGYTCRNDYSEPYDLDTWIENDDLAVSEGVYKDDWMHSRGTSYLSYRFLGSIYYTNGTRVGGPPTNPPTEPPALIQYTPAIKDWSTLNDKSVLQHSLNADHNIDSVHWIDRSQWLPWDGTPYNASQYSRRDLADLVCPGNTIRGLREVFYEANPFSDPVNPTKAEVDNWHAIAINHVRALVGYTEDEYQIEPDQCLHVRALWTEERKNTEIWTSRYPDNTCHGSTNPHCGATFIPSVEDQQPYLPEGVESCTARAGGSEGLFNAAKSNIPWSIRFIRPLCHTLGAEGFWGGHTGPWFHRKQFGFSWRDMDPENQNSNTGLVAKWAGPKGANKYVDPRITNGDFLLLVEGEDPNPRFQDFECDGRVWLEGGSPNATDCYHRTVGAGLNQRFFTWKQDGGCAGYPADMERCTVVGSATRLTWDLDPRSFSFDGLIVDPDDVLWNGRECRNIRWKSEAGAGDPSHCLENLMDLQYEDCGRNFMTWNSANGGCACYAPEQECDEREDTVGRSGRKTYRLLPDPAYEPPPPNSTAPEGGDGRRRLLETPHWIQQREGARRLRRELSESSDQPSALPSSMPSSQPSSSGVPSESPSVSDTPTSQPSTRPSSSGQPSWTTTPISLPSLQPSVSIFPSTNPSLSRVPSESPSVSNTPTSPPSTRPSFSGQPSSTSNPSLSLIPSSQPSISIQPTSPLELDSINELPTGISLSFFGVDGYMFVITAKQENIIVKNFALLLYTQYGDYSDVEVSVWTSLPGDHYDAQAGEELDGQPRWTEHASIFVPPSIDLTPDQLPHYMGNPPFPPVTIPAGTSIGFYVTVKDRTRQVKILVIDSGTSIEDVDVENDDISVRQGIGKQWNWCDNYGDTLSLTGGAPYPWKLYGGIYYNTAGTYSPALVPTLKPSFMPSLSLVPSTSIMPSLEPTLVIAPPTLSPTSTSAPSLTMVELITPTNAGEGEDDGQQEGNGGDGIMFDVVASESVEIHSITFSQLAHFTMHIQVWSRDGSHYGAYDNPGLWEMIQEYTHYTFHINGDEDNPPRRISFPSQRIIKGQAKSFYLAIVDTYGEAQDPMAMGLAAGTNYLNGVWASNDDISIMEGVKFFGISKTRPFGNGTELSGIYNHQGPGGISYNMQGAMIRYRPFVTSAPSESPSLSQIPSQSQVPSSQPTASDHPSLSPSISSKPSSIPSESPSFSGEPSSQPSMSPSVSGVPSSSPSESPSISERPSSSGEPSSQPSMSPSVSGAPSSSPSESPSISERPSSQPSESPSTSDWPTSMPSESPTISWMPSSSPSETPSISSQPSSQPSSRPSEIPSTSTSPSELPSISSRPSSQPSGTPSISTEPSSQPSESPSISSEPSSAPSELPSISAEPSSQPSSQPSESPSVSAAPSSQPSEEPSTSNWPTSQPSETPSISSKPSLSAEPSSQPSESPSTSVLPSSMPSAMPSVSGAPSSQPSMNPSISSKPSSMPSKLPSISFQPSSQPSTSPSVSNEPSTMPSESPSISFWPSSQPSESPSISTKPSLSSNPSSKPSESPSVSEKPSMSVVPSTSNLPTIGLSSPPSFVPSISALPSVSLEPSSLPTRTPHPSKTPSISVSPTSPPTTSPTSRPTESPTVSFRPTVGAQTPQVKIVIPAAITITGFRPPETVAEIATVVNIVGPSVADLVSRDLRTTQRLKSVIIISINGILVPGGSQFQFSRRNLAARYLQEGADIDVEYEITLEEICSVSSCDDAQEIANELYQSVTYAMQQEIDSGAFTTTLEKTAAELDMIVELAVKEADFSDLVVEVLGLASNWYPAWTNGKYCLNDGAYPFYMRHSSADWIYNSRDGCCTRFYAYSYAECMGMNNIGAIGYYPAWERGEFCKNDTEVPDYMRTNAGQWVYKDIESCCLRYFGWNYENCVVGSGASSAAAYTNLWYVDHSNQVCKKDCAESDGGSCGGSKPSYKTSYDSAVICCESTLSWIAASVCEAKSLSTTATGSSKWYVDHANQKCVQDCASPGVNATCGGVVSDAYVELFDTPTSCCSSGLSWLDEAGCVVASANTGASATTGTNQWYVDHKIQRCVQDCEGAAPCGGLRSTWDHLYSDSSSCCSERLWWLDARVSCILA